jgi:hypothetical protein
MLSYEIIIKHLMPIQNIFSQNPHLSISSSTFNHFNKIFDDTFYRYGIISQVNFINVSLKNSILFCLEELINVSDNIDINNIINIVNDIDINIIIFDFKNNKISSQYNGEYFNPWKPTIYLANYDEWWEPIVSKDSKIFSFSSNKSNILKNNILMQNITKYNTDEIITINDNFNEIIELSGFNVNNNLIDDNETFIKIDNIPKTKLEKMKKDELIELCKSMDKSININKPTKKDLIEIILNN